MLNKRIIFFAFRFHVKSNALRTPNIMYLRPNIFDLKFTRANIQYEAYLLLSVWDPRNSLAEADEDCFTL